MRLSVLPLGMVTLFIEEEEGAEEEVEERREQIGERPLDRDLT